MKTNVRSASEKQMKLLMNAGYRKEELNGMTQASASSLIDKVAKNNWKRSQRETALVKAATSGLARSAVAVPILDDGKLDDLASCLNEDERDLERSYRNSIRDYTRMMAKGIGESLLEYKELYGRYGKWLPFLAIIGINVRTAQRYMKLAGMVDVPEPVANALERSGVKLNGQMTRQDERVVRAAVSSYSLESTSYGKNDKLSYCSQPVDSNRAASRAVKAAIEQIIPPAPKPPIDILPAEPDYEQSWDVLENTLRSLQHDPQFYDRLLKVLEEFAPEVVNDAMSA